MNLNVLATNLMNWIFIAGIISPILVATVKALGQWTHNQALINLADRAQVIVDSLSHNNVLSNSSKKETAMNKLSNYASEVGIKATPDQLDDYIEAAVKTVKEVGDASQK